MGENFLQKHDCNLSEMYQLSLKDRWLVHETSLMEEGLCLVFSEPYMSSLTLTSSDSICLIHSNTWIPSLF